MIGKVLILYYHNLGYPLRNTNYDMLYCFRKFSDKYCFYVNVAFGIPKYLKDINFDLIIFHDLLLCKRDLPIRIYKFYKKSKILENIIGYKIALVQDEFKQVNILNEFLNKFKIQHIFSLAPKSEWEKIYYNINFNNVKIDSFLTGYINESIIQKCNILSIKTENRFIDIGYRANYSKRYSLGSIGFLKYKIADVFKQIAPQNYLKVDISTDIKDTKLGDEWLKFLLNCKYTLGVESGASIIDYDGSVELKVANYLKEKPQATFNEVKEKILKNLDGNFNYSVIGPRHFEACITKTCQILIEGEYSGVLKPFIHYLPIKKDFSNIDEIINIIKEDKIRKIIILQAYNDIVLSGKYTYKFFVEYIFEKSKGKDYPWSELSKEEFKLFKKNLRREKVVWKYIRIRTLIINCIIDILPLKIYKKIENFMKKQR